MDVKDFKFSDKLAADPEASQHKTKTHDLLLKLL